MRIKAYAKINLTLEILGRRPDGYHEVRTVLQTVDLADLLRFESAEGLEIRSSAPELSGRDNLVWRAADTLRRATGCQMGATIELEKRIPVSMGLGGGSSDAAATLVGLNQLLGLGLDTANLRSIGASLGSDVPSFLPGGTTLASGRGEKITELSPIHQRWVVLLCPSTDSDPAASKTARLYSLITPGHYSDGTNAARMAAGLDGAGVSNDMLFNVFEDVAPQAFQSYDEHKKRLMDAGAPNVHLCGSGPGLFSLVESQEQGDAILKHLQKKELEGYCVSTISASLGSPPQGSEWSQS